MGADEEALAALRPLGMLCSCPTGSSEVSAHKRARDALPPLLRAVAGGSTSAAGAAASAASASAEKRGEFDAVRAAESAVAAASIGAGVGPEHLTVLVHGPPGVGKSAAVAAAASSSSDGGGSSVSGGLFPHVKVFRADVVGGNRTTETVDVE